MTTTTTTIGVGLQQKKRRQAIFLAIGGGLLALLLLFQLPKLMGGDEAAPAAESTAADTAPAADGSATSSAPAATTTAPAATAEGTTTMPSLVIPTGTPVTSAQLGGVVVPGRFAVEGSEGDLLVFSMFPAKDPFVQQVDDLPATVGTDAGYTGENAAPSATPAKPVPAAEPAGTATDASGGVVVSGGDTVTATPEKPPVLTFATVGVNGDPVAIALKAPFPAPQNLFVLRKLTDTSAQLAIAGTGSFTGGRKTVTLVMGKQLTLVDQATGVRYSLKLLYTGTSPEQVESFNAIPTGTEAPAATTGTEASADK